MGTGLRKKGGVLLLNFCTPPLNQPCRKSNGRRERMIFYHGLKHFNDRLCHVGPLDFHGGFQAAGQFHPGCGIRFGTARRIYCREMPAVS